MYKGDFRFAMVKYADRGLANDRYYYNMNMRLFTLLFWTASGIMILMNQAMVITYYVKHGEKLHFYNENINSK